MGMRQLASSVIVSDLYRYAYHSYIDLVSEVVRERWPVNHGTS